MRPTPRRGIPILMAFAMLLAIAPASASAITLQRTWTSRLGTSGSNGTITLRAYTNGVGSIRYTLQGLRANTSYGVQIRYGSCANLGLVVATPASFQTSASGTVSHVDNLLPWVMNRIWPAARKPGFVVRIVGRLSTGTSIRCGAFSFNTATRVTVPALNINLPVMRGPTGYPYCRVAMYLPATAQPREPGVTFIYAHARTGMFLPLLTRWRINAGRSLYGMTVKVWTSDRYVSYYRIISVRKSSNPMGTVTSLTSERLWLQTSTGPNYTYAKLVVVASRYKTIRSTYAASHPTPHPVRC